MLNKIKIFILYNSKKLYISAISTCRQVGILFNLGHSGRLKYRLLWIYFIADNKIKRD